MHSLQPVSFISRRTCSSFQKVLYLSSVSEELEGHRSYCELIPQKTNIISCMYSLPLMYLDLNDLESSFAVYHRCLHLE